MNAFGLPHHLYLYLSLLLTATVGWVGCGSNERTPLEWAEYYFSRPDYPKALEACQTALAEATTDEEKADIFVIRGRCYIGQAYDAQKRDEGDRAAKLFEKAITDLTTALELHSEHVDALHNRRLAYRLTNQLELAAKDYARIRKLDPNYQLAYQRERDDDIHLQRPKEIDADKAEDGQPEEPAAEEQPVFEPGDDENEPGNQENKMVAAGSGGISQKAPTHQISVADFEPPVPDPASRYSRWASQHQPDPTLGRQPAIIPSPSIDRTLAGLDPGLDEKSDPGQRNAEATPEENSEPAPEGPTSPLHWPSSSQWPQAPTPNNPELPTGIVGPVLHPPTSDPWPTLPHRGMVAPTGSTGVGVEPIPDRLGPYIPQLPYTSHPLPTTGIDGAISLPGAEASRLGPYRPAIPESMRAPTPRDTSIRNTQSPSQLPNAPKRPSKPTSRLQPQTRPLSTPTLPSGT